MWRWPMAFLFRAAEQLSLDLNLSALPAPPITVRDPMGWPPTSSWRGVPGFRSDRTFNFPALPANLRVVIYDEVLPSTISDGTSPGRWFCDLRRGDMPAIPVPTIDRIALAGTRKVIREDVTQRTFQQLKYTRVSISAPNFPT